VGWRGISNLTGGIVAIPSSRIALADRSRTRPAAGGGTNTQAEYPIDKCIHELFEAQVVRTPDAVAVVFEAATHLPRIEKGQSATNTTGTGQSLMCWWASAWSDRLDGGGTLGILKAGMPLDPAYPQERLGRGARRRLCAGTADSTADAPL